MVVWLRFAYGYMVIENFNSTYRDNHITIS